MTTQWKYRSQKGQDEWVIESVFDFKEDGYFVDLAAADGVKFSNTYCLEECFGWGGICIEGNPRFINALRRNRVCRIANEVIDSEDGNQVEFRIDNMLGGGIVAENTDNRTRHGATIIKRKTVSLESILERNGSPSEIDYLSLDVEGAETRVLSTFPFDRYTFLAMTIERPSVALEKILFSNGYCFCKSSKFDIFYVHESIPNCPRIAKEPYSPTPAKKF